MGVALFYQEAPILTGQTLGHYEILDQLGKGGMGEVYRALDTTLDREVALKVLPTEVASDPDRMWRFEREAKTLAALSHPNIVTIHTVESVDDVHFLTMELVDGKPLSQLIPHDGMGLASLFDVAISLSDALSAAHEKGVVHRDLKPANIMVNNHGQVKVLDFGLAKLLDPATRVDRLGTDQPHTGTSLPETEASTQLLTQEGTIVGTVPYMSPEQLEGGEIDARSDIFSLGIILYEMATGKRPFRGESSIAIISSIIKDAPEEVDQLRGDLPHHLGRIVRRCLEKSPQRRTQSALEVRNELEDLRREQDSADRSATVRVRQSEKPPGLWRWVTVAALVLLASIAVWQLAIRQSEQDVAAHDMITVPRIVILPFENLGLPEDEYFADGITEEITSRLSAVAGLSVISRTTAMQYKESRPPLTQIAQDLEVDYALEGTVRWARDGEGPSRVRVTPQLIRLPDDSHLWSESYDRVVDDLFAIQSELAQQVLIELNVALIDTEREFVEVRPTQSLEAYQAYLRGKHLLRQPHFTLESWNRALASLEQAVELDPEFSQAWAELARAHSRLIYFKVDPSPERLERADHAMEQALAGDSDSPQVHLAAGYYHLWALRDAELAREEFLIAAQRIPNNTDVLEGLGESARLRGHIDEAIPHYRRAAELSPLDPSPLVELGLSLWWARRYEEAFQACNRAAVVAPDHAWPYITSTLNFWSWKGGTPQARETLEAFSGDHPWMPWLWYWQDIYEERYTDAIERLTRSPEVWTSLKICIRPDSLFASYALELANQSDLARAEAEKAAAVLRAKVLENPDEPRYHSSLGIALALLGQHEEAIRAGKRAIELFPLSADAIYAQMGQQDLAHIYLLSGEYKSACDQLELLLSIPGWISIPLLESDPRWATLRNQPCYRELLTKFDPGKS